MIIILKKTLNLKILLLISKAPSKKPVKPPFKKPPSQSHSLLQNSIRTTKSKNPKKFH